jgi:hypothetical protein
MTIYQAQPCRIYPFLFTESKENFPLLRYEFSDQFIYSNINDAKIAFSCHINNMSPEMHSLPKTLKEAEYCLFLAPPRKKNGYSISDNRTYEVIDDYIIWDWSKEIDFLYGLFSACYLENFEKYKKNTDFSFTVIDHPMKQIVNLYYYFKGGIKEIKDIKELRERYKTDPKLKKSLTKEYLKDKNNVLKFNAVITNVDSYSRFQKKYFNKTEEESKLEVYNFYQGVTKYSIALIESMQNHLESLEKWIDFIIDTKGKIKIKDIHPDIKNEVHINEIFFHCSKLYKNHDYYGIMDSRENLLKSVEKINELNKSTNLIYDGDYFFTWKDFPIYEYRKNELEKVLEEDIDFFKKKKELL